MRAAKPGSVQCCVQEAYRAAGGLECVSDDLGLSISTLSQHTEKPDGRKKAGGLGINYADTLARMHPAVAVVLAEHFAALAGGRFERFQSGDAREAWEHVSALCREVAEAVEKLSDPNADPAEIQKELRDVVNAACAAQRDTASLVTVPHLGEVKAK
ncbi:hypothetical protein [Roseovarius sp.]|uniref:hypothetical protein n=1 Tax=Roseovarius sp. TaxID=1486281 RepID=UPI003BA95C30